MIVKSFSINYEKLYSDYTVNLIYGENFYLKNEIINKLSKLLKEKSINLKFIKEEEIIKDSKILDNYFLQDNLFQEKEIFIIQNVTDKILEIINIDAIKKKIVLMSDNLSKRNKIRNYAEKFKNIACIACYDDNEMTLRKILTDGLSNLDIKIPQEVINKMFDINKLNRCDINSGLEKLSLITKNKKLDNEIFLSLFNTTSSYNVFEISNALLCSDKKTINKIFSYQYHFSTSFNEVLGPLKYKINKLIDIYNYTKNESNVLTLINTYKPTIFWKEKNIIHDQLEKWSKEELDILLDKINEIEILCKINYDIAGTIFNKFLLDIITKRVLTNTYS